jgi:hypothetical protein
MHCQQTCSERTVSPDVGYKELNPFRSNIRAYYTNHGKVISLTVMSCMALLRKLFPVSEDRESAFGVL